MGSLEVAGVDASRSRCSIVWALLPRPTGSADDINRTSALASADSARPAKDPHATVLPFSALGVISGWHVKRIEF